MLLVNLRITILIGKLLTLIHCFQRLLGKFINIHAHSSLLWNND